MWIGVPFTSLHHNKTHRCHASSCKIMIPPSHPRRWRPDLFLGSSTWLGSTTSRLFWYEDEFPFMTCRKRWAPYVLREPLKILSTFNFEFTLREKGLGSSNQVRKRRLTVGPDPSPSRDRGPFEPNSGLRSWEPRLTVGETDSLDPLGLFSYL